MIFFYLKLLKSAKLRNVSKSSPVHSKSTFWRQRCGRTVASFHLADSGKSQTLRAHAQSTAHTSVYKDMMLATQPCASLFLYAMSTHASVLPSLGFCPHTQTRGDIVHSDGEQEKEQVCWQHQQWQQHQWQQQQCSRGTTKSGPPRAQSGPHCMGRHQNLLPDRAYFHDDKMLGKRQED